MKHCFGNELKKKNGVPIDLRNYNNYTDKLQKIRHLIKLWKRRYLTPLGKIRVIKTLLLPILNHLLISIPNPNDQILKELNSIFFEFLWEGPAKIKQYEVNLLRIITTTDSPWQSIIKGTVNFNEIFSFGTSYIESLLPKIKNKFWTHVLKAYSRGYDSVIRRMQSWVCLLYNLHNTHEFILHMTPGHTKNELMVLYRLYCKHTHDCILRMTESYPRDIQKCLNLIKLIMKTLFSQAQFSITMKLRLEIIKYG